MGSPYPTPHSLASLSDRSMPGRDREEFGSWICRAADGVTSRANSCTPSGSPEAPIAQAIETVEGWFADHGLPPIFQVWDGGDPDVASELDRRGYRRKEGADVLVLDMAALDAAARGRERTPLTDSSARVEVADGIDALMQTTAGTRGLAELGLSTLPKLAATISHGPAADGAASDATMLLSSGVGVLDGTAIGLFAMATAPQYRRKGLAADVLATLLDAGLARGAEVAWLQVMPSNVGASRLYRSVGFGRAHAYHYRTVL